MKTMKQIEAMLSKFLEERVESDCGDWPNITNEHMEQLQSLIQSIIDTKFERDADGKAGVEFKLVNRKTHEKLSYVPVPYSFKNPNDSTEAVLVQYLPGTNQWTHFDAVHLNYKLASGQLNTALDLQRDYLNVRRQEMHELTHGKPTRK